MGKNTIISPYVGNCLIYSIESGISRPDLRDEKLSFKYEWMWIEIPGLFDFKKTV